MNYYQIPNFSSRKEATKQEKKKELTRK